MEVEGIGFSASEVLFWVSNVGKVGFSLSVLSIKNISSNCWPMLELAVR